MPHTHISMEYCLFGLMISCLSQSKFVGRGNVFLKVKKQTDFQPCKPFFKNVIGTEKFKAKHKLRTILLNKTINFNRRM